MDIYCDGGCRNNQKKTNIGAWAFATYYKDEEIYHLSDAEENTTNNKMELTACIWALSIEGEKYDDITIYSDSKYVIDGVNVYSHKWRRNGWKSSSGEIIKNVELWKQLINLVSINNVIFKHIKGHSGNKGNERVDELLNKEMDNYIPRIINYEDD